MSKGDKFELLLKLKAGQRHCPTQLKALPWHNKAAKGGGIYFDPTNPASQPLEIINCEFDDNAGDVPYSDSLENYLADLDGHCIVGFADLLILFENWGDNEP